MPQNVAAVPVVADAAANPHAPKRPIKKVRLRVSAAAERSGRVSVDARARHPWPR